ncbi:MAG TPA: glycosyltransferase [Fimbriimonadaceae bacterium]|nr:glycosyltransferase [Fimbriimonadaceae bacterium]
MPRVSVLLTCYNHLAYLPAAFGSICAQTYTDLEIIALDDGSTDGTREWLKENAKNARLIFNAKNLGTYGTLNVGLHHAQGELVAVLNDDDVWKPSKLERQVALLDGHPTVGLVHTDGSFIDAEGRRMEGSPLGFDFPRTETGDVLLSLVYANKIIASAALVRKRCFEELGGFNEAYFGSGDWEMWYRIAERYHVGYVADELTLYRVHGANASHKLERIWQDDERIRTWIGGRYDELEKHGTAQDVRKAMAHNEACLGTVKVLNGDPAGGREAFRRSLRYDPGRWKSRLRWAASYLPRSLFRRLL